LQTNPPSALRACPDYSCGLLAIEQGWVLALIVATGLPTTVRAGTRNKEDPVRSPLWLPTKLIPAGALSCSGIPVERRSGVTAADTPATTVGRETRHLGLQIQGPSLSNLPRRARGWVSVRVPP